MVYRSDCCGNCGYRYLDHEEEVYRCGNEGSANHGAMVVYEDICDDYEEVADEEGKGKRIPH